MVYAVTKFWFYPFSWIMIRKIKGAENIPEEAPFIIASNHEKLIDPLFIIYPILKKLDKKVHFLATPTWWFLGDIICRQWAGCIPLFNSKKAYRKTKELVNAGEIVGIFPEGHLEAEIRNPKSGAVKLALETNIPILPIGVKSSYLPFSSRITIGKPVYPNKIKNIEKQTLDLMNRIYSLRGN